MGLQTVSVSKCLDKKLMMFGFEVPDLIVIFLTLSVLNFLFGQTSFRVYFVWLPTILLAAILRVGKKGRPDNFLTHWVRFQIKPGTYSAFLEPSIVTPPPNRQFKKGRL